jgi:hypothetical protein
MSKRETRVVMKNESSQLFGYMAMLIGSYADHDIITDIFVSQSDPRRYREALDGINECTRRIVESGLSREQLMDPGSSPDKDELYSRLYADQMRSICIFSRAREMQNLPVFLIVHI